MKEIVVQQKGKKKKEEERKKKEKQENKRRKNFFPLSCFVEITRHFLRKNWQTPFKEKQTHLLKQSTFSFLQSTKQKKGIKSKFLLSWYLLDTCIPCISYTQSIEFNETGPKAFEFISLTQWSLWKLTRLIN